MTHAPLHIVKSATYTISPRLFADTTVDAESESNKSFAQKK